MKKEYIIKQQGRDYALYSGLLDQAHQEGLCRITTKVLQIPSADNENVAICFAEVETSKGVFTGIGDASPKNVGKQVALHLLRMSETRAKARALRDAVNVGEAAFEELGGTESPVAHETGPDSRHVDLIVRAQTKMASLGHFKGDPSEVPPHIASNADAATLLGDYKRSILTLQAVVNRGVDPSTGEITEVSREAIDASPLVQPLQLHVPLPSEHVSEGPPVSEAQIKRMADAKNALEVNGLLDKAEGYSLDASDYTGDSIDPVLSHLVGIFNTHRAEKKKAKSASAPVV